MRSNKINLAKYRPVKVKQRDQKKEKLLKKKISEVSQVIRKKFLALKMGKAEEDETINRILSPIIEPLKEIKTNTVQAIQTRPVIPAKEEQIPQRRQTSPVRFIKDEVFSDEESEKQSIEDIQEEYYNFKHNRPVLDQYLSQFPHLSRHYIEGFFTNRDQYDENSGARLNLKTNKLIMGNKELHIGDNNELSIGGKPPYVGTKGLYELIFMKKPQGYTENDLNNYKEILEISSAHKRDYKPEERVKGNKYFKYMNIIKPLLAQTQKRRSKSQSSLIPTPASTSSLSQSSLIPTSTSSLRRKDSSPHQGFGMMVYNEKPVEYIYWDDINEIVDRLKLLIASKSAGNTSSHDNEILSIISELKEVNIIS